MIVNLAPQSSLQPIRPSASSRLLLEPLLVAATSIFWIVVLPISAIFCAAVKLYDRVAALSRLQLRLPLLRSHLRANPLMLPPAVRRSDERSASAKTVQHPIGA